MSTTARLSLQTIPLMLNVKQGSREYQFLKSFGVAQQGNEPRSTTCKADALTRDGVENTRLEAKAKDTKKFRVQGQGQTLSRPRTKDTDASVLKKKKSLQKFFSGNLKKKIFKKIF